jgi:hypothetical protein
MTLYLDYIMVKETTVRRRTDQPTAAVYSCITEQQLQHDDSSSDSNDRLKKTTNGVMQSQYAQCVGWHHTIRKTRYCDILGFPW